MIEGKIEILEINWDKNKMKLKFNNLSDGIYLLKFFIGDETVTKKILIQK